MGEWQQLFSEFMPVLDLLRQVRSDCLPGAVEEMLQHPAYFLMEQLADDLNLVYSPPKVGGTTITATLNRHPAVRSGASHVHFLSPRGLAFLERLIVGCAEHPIADIWRTHLAMCRWLRVLLAANRALRLNGQLSVVRKPYLIAGVREPIALHLSMMFEVGWMYAAGPEALTTEIVHAHLADGWHRFCNDWFNDDLKEMFGVDVFARAFPTERGWDIYENEQARILLIRQESLSKLPVAVGELYGFDPTTVEVETSNTAENKQYAARYDAVKDALSLSAQELDEAYGLPYVRHFYSLEEIERYKARWRAGRIPGRRSKQKAASHSESRHAGQPNVVAPVPPDQLRSPTHLMSPHARQREEQMRRAARLQQTCDERQAVINELRSACDAREAEIASLQVACKERLAMIHELTATCEERLAVIDQLTATCKEREETIRQLNLAPVGPWRKAVAWLSQWKRVA